MPSPTGLTHAVMQTLSHGDHLLQLVSGDQADDNRFIQQFSRNTDTNQLAQCVRERATRQGEIADVIHSYGQTAAGIRLEFNTLTAMERVVVADLPQGEGMQAGEKTTRLSCPKAGRCWMKFNASTKMPRLRPKRSSPPNIRLSNIRFSCVSLCS